MTAHAKSADKIRAALLAHESPMKRLLGASDRMILRKRGYRGPGVARYGWWSIGAAQDYVWLGRTVREAVSFAP